MARYKSIIAYDGTDFQGFQRQPGGRTVQGTLEEALRSLGWQGESLLAAGRTDRGVHARGQVVAFDLRWRQGAEALQRALNAHLPQDVSVCAVREAPDDFHPRFDAQRRHYRYTLLISGVRDPLRERFAWRVWPRPEVSAMARTAAGFVGRHDFRAFGRAPIPDGHTVRRIFRAAWTPGDHDRWMFDVVADAFLNRMVRRLVAAMVAVGQGKVALEEVLGLLDQPQARWERSLAPARGLCLEAVIYAEDLPG